jgi:glycosyltransferase involved in cell wall biosynthesis
MKWSLVSAVNNDTVLNSCLLASPDVRTAHEQFLLRGFASAAEAYNTALDQATSDLIVFAHQDVYFPPGWLSRLEQVVATLSAVDPQWGVLGVWGVANDGRRFGHVYCAGLGQMLGGGFDGVREVRTLDEVVLIVRRSSGLRFDERLPGFHLYGADVCLEAEKRGLKSYAVSALCIHNTNGYGMLPLAFWKNYVLLRRKWKHVLPVITSCTEVSFWFWPMIRWNVVQAANIALGRHTPGVRVRDPRKLTDLAVHDRASS